MITYPSLSQRERILDQLVRIVLYYTMLPQARTALSGAEAAQADREKVASA